MSRTLGISTLIAKKACASQVALFAEKFGGSVAVTRETCVKHAADFEWRWAARYLLCAAARQAYDAACAPAEQAYDAACAAAREAYDAACAPAEQAYDAACAPARQAYDAACAPARQAYRAACAAAREAYDAARAAAFADAYNSDSAA